MTTVETSYLKRALWLAIFSPRGSAKPARTIIESPNLRPMWEEWGRAGDVAVVAEISGSIVGAAWARTYRTPTYGYISNRVPIVGIALEEAFRGAGTGTRLLDELCTILETRGVSAVSLSVDPGNPARKLYERRGFVKVEPPIRLEDDDATTMVLNF